MGLHLFAKLAQQKRSEIAKKLSSARASSFVVLSHLATALEFLILAEVNAIKIKPS